MNPFMNVYGHFACYTKIPIRLDDVCGYIKDEGIVDEFRFLEVKTDPTRIPGLLRQYTILRNGGTHRVAEIYHSTLIEDDGYRRIVCCKEILHALDGDESTAESREAVDRLIEHIVIPPSVGAEVSKSVDSDQFGVLHAIMVLFPRDSLAELRPLYQRGELNAEGIATLVHIPVGFVRFALSDTWARVV